MSRDLIISWEWLYIMIDSIDNITDWLNLINDNAVTSVWEHIVEQ